MARFRNLVVVASLLLVCGGYFRQSQAAMVGHWTFDLNMNDAIGGNHGVVSGAGNNTFIAAGTIGGAASFDGDNDRIVIPQAVIPQTSFAISFWEFSPSPAAAPAGYFLGASDNLGNNLQLFVRRLNSATYAGGMNQGTGGGTFGEIPIANNTWNHNFITHSNTGSAAWYVNGIQIATLNSNGTFTQLNYDLNVGNRADLLRDFQGLIDDLAIWNTSLGQIEARAMHSLGLNLGQQGSLFDYNYDAGQVQQLLDAHAELGTVTIEADYWEYATGLGAIAGGAQPGQLFSFNGQTYLLLSGDTGLLQTILPAPEPSTGILLLLGTTLLRKRRPAKEHATVAGVLSQNESA